FKVRSYFYRATETCCYCYAKARNRSACFLKSVEHFRVSLSELLQRFIRFRKFPTEIGDVRTYLYKNIVYLSHSFRSPNLPRNSSNCSKRLMIVSCRSLTSSAVLSVPTSPAGRLKSCDCFNFLE